MIKINSQTAQLYVLNERLYKYILPFTPKFPQDFQGPLVDKYLAIKYQEMEEMLKKEKEEKAAAMQEDEGKEVKEKPDVDSFNEDDDGGTIEGEIEIPEQVIEVHPTIESSTKAQLIESTEVPQTSTHHAYEQQHEEQDLQSIEPQVEIKNVGVSGHLTHSVDLS